MNIFKRKSTPKDASKKGSHGDQAAMSEMALKAIHDGVVITDKDGVIKFINPAAATMTGYGSPDKALNLDYGLVIRLESKEGRELSENENPLIQAVKSGQALDSFQGCIIVGQSDKRVPVAISVLPPEGISQERIITFRNIAKELEEEGEQTEFISTASHEMRTPVATIDGYISLALNPQTATIDERARGYLTAAEGASKHLGKLFQDLLDVTKLDDGRIRPHFEPVEMVEFVKNIVADYTERAKQAKVNLTFGSSQSASFSDNRKIEQIAYGFIDANFMREILDNLIDNALKYTPDGGSVYINVRGDGDRTLINVTDTGIGISSEDIGHIFQKFYRVDNSDTRTIGGTGLGLYIVKQRVEAMGGKIWAESAFGEGTTFYVSLPRLSQEEYDKRMIVVRNQQINQQITQQANQPSPAPIRQPVFTPPAQSSPAPVQPSPAPVQRSSTPAQPSPAPVQPAVMPSPQPSTRPATPPQPPSVAPISNSPPQPTPLSTLNSTPNQIDINLNGEHK